MILRSKESIVLDHLIKGYSIDLYVPIKDKKEVKVTCKLSDGILYYNNNDGNFIKLECFTLKEFLKICNKLSNEEINKILLHKINFN